ncbi:MAG TPA: BON domain-containing protein [Bryobacteraceae bacterium]
MKAAPAITATLLMVVALAQNGRCQTASRDSATGSAQVQRIAQQVHKAIVTLPQYGVFDDINFAIKGDDTVILRGEASRPVLKSSAENVVKKIEGVKQVINEIDVLPVSPNDDRIRALAYARIYRHPWLSRYTNNRSPQPYSPTRAVTGITNDPPVGWHAIHIIVKNGNIRLAGVVDSESDLALAEMQARSVPGAFAVENDLMVANEGKK